MYKGEDSGEDSEDDLDYDKEEAELKLKVFIFYESFSLLDNSDFFTVAVAVEAAVRLWGERGVQLVLLLPLRLRQGELLTLRGQLKPGAHLPLHLLLLHYQQTLRARQLPTATILNPSGLQRLASCLPALPPFRGVALGHVENLQLLSFGPALGHPGKPAGDVPRIVPPRRHCPGVGEQEAADKASPGLELPNQTLRDYVEAAQVIPESRVL